MDNITEWATETLINNVILLIIIFAVIFAAFEVRMIKKDTTKIKQDVAAIRRYIDSWEELEASIDYRKDPDESVNETDRLFK